MTDPYVATIEPAESGGWTVTVPEVGETAVDDPRSAEYAVRTLVRNHRGRDYWLAERTDVHLLDTDGVRVYGFVVLCTGRPADNHFDTNAPQYAAMRAAPPQGCQYRDFGGYPALVCLRPGASRLAAISGVVAELRDKFGIDDANDLGFEKLWEWAGPPDERQQLVAHLLLMAAYRARLVDLDTEDLVDFLRAVTPLGS